MPASHRPGSNLEILRFESPQHGLVWVQHAFECTMWGDFVFFGCSQHSKWPTPADSDSEGARIKTALIGYWISLLHCFMALITIFAKSVTCFGIFSFFCCSQHLRWPIPADSDSKGVRVRMAMFGFWILLLYFYMAPLTFCANSKRV